ncbi:hypothetical protein EDD29_0840 [Actinocorallia herbida]|uniref:Uncharacterized protein n=1 Tax=Actinocorallia herbida TaxID=58109 RepID=A0A3N1CPV6_9ACTN|nr:hypothetical protein [Actinocorallia herbida]ROO83340.1 hypothetical protein EDD29_0840 [Actinocorallia herbida]
MSGDLVEISAEWAQWGKRADDRGYEVLAHSAAHFTRENFHQLLQRFSPGTPERLPQVTIGWAGQKRTHWVGIGIQEASSRPDRVGRRVSETRFFCVPYEILRHNQVTYLDLFQQFWNVSLPDEGMPVTVTVPLLRPDHIEVDLTSKAEKAAALLITGKPICVVAGERVTVHDRLRFLDAAAALLPYGVRTKLSASTWTSSTADHKIRFSFTDEPREDSFNLFWDSEELVRPREEPPRATWQMAVNYQTRLRESLRRDHLVGRLAGTVAPVSFEDPHLLLKALDDRPSDVHFGDAGGRMPDDPPEVVRALGAALESGETDKVDSCLKQLKIASAANHPEHVKKRLRENIMTYRLFSAAVRVQPSAKVALYQSLFATAFGQRLTEESYKQIVDFVGRASFSKEHIQALRQLTTGDVWLKFTLAWWQGADVLGQLLQAASPDELVTVAADVRTSHELREAVFREIDRRDPSEELATALLRHAFLCDVLRRHLPGVDGAQAERLKKLLAKVYGHEGFGPRELQEALTSGEVKVLPTVALIGAAAETYGEGAGAALIHKFLAVVIEQSGMNRLEKDRIHALLQDVPAPLYSPAEAAGFQAGLVAHASGGDLRSTWPGRLRAVLAGPIARSTLIALGLVAVVVAIVLLLA